LNEVQILQEFLQIPRIQMQKKLKISIKKVFCRRSLIF